MESVVVVVAAPVVRPATKRYESYFLDGQLP